MYKLAEPPMNCFYTYTTNGHFTRPLRALTTSLSSHSFLFPVPISLQCLQLPSTTREGFFLSHLLAHTAGRQSQTLRNPLTGSTGWTLFIHRFPQVLTRCLLRANYVPGNGPSVSHANNSSGLLPSY